MSLRQTRQASGLEELRLTISHATVLDNNGVVAAEYGTLIGTHQKQESYSAIAEPGLDWPRSTRLVSTFSNPH
jgi:hypothetical protein